MASPLQNSIEFFREFGLFDVVLPFLLVFTLMFAILEKTRVLGTENDKPRANLNSMVSFIIALLVVATNKIVSIINEALPNVVLIIVMILSFLIMLGLFYKTEELDFSKKHAGFYKILVGVLFIGILLIFLNSIYLSGTKTSWLEYVFNYTFNNVTSPAVTSIIFLLIALGAIVFITGGKKKD